MPNLVIAEIRYRLTYDGPLLSALWRTFMQHREVYYRDQVQPVRPRSPTRFTSL